MKTKTKKRLLIVVAIITALFFYGCYNFEKDKQELIRIKTLALNADSKTIFNELKKPNNFTNPIVSLVYNKWKGEMYSRFIDKDEVFKNTSDNTMVNGLSKIYRNYYADEFLKENLKDRSSEKLYKKLGNYLNTNKLTTHPKDSLSDPDFIIDEIASLLRKDDFEYRFLARNGIDELLIWNDITKKEYTVVLPKDTINTTVVFINSFHLEDFDNFVTYGSSNVGGWAIEEKATLYCNKTAYALGTEEFNISYLKHETLHFTDLNDYPNLSTADLEYRAKLVELMYLTEETMYSKLFEFLNSASNKDRNYSHNYANYILIGDLSKTIFNSEYENDFDKWKAVKVEAINNVAKELYYSSNAKLAESTEVKEII
ncbi:hypothetical protein [Lacinutrix sp. Bg11-31]|uniref:hypothetical protein n=1 Tax=Lacinutrix sp. Bg11-31 TaxID=2057808 RepID=UPI000C316745|nr:hypothetical protein [Lacinutrix sp. Bg11-31]AUC81329.1 hypothetical protein CW733_03955 [Lacinutrix sp. Bg11-31]